MGMPDRMQNMTPETTGPTWTPEQTDAIYTRGCDVLVSAGAGAGKTAVLVERVIQGLVADPKDGGLDIERLLVVTFTEAAAAEMCQRIREALERRLGQEPENSRLQGQLARLPLASISTIHAFCSRLLRQYFYHLGLDPGFRIMTEAEASLLKYETIDQVLAECYLEGNEAVLDLVDAYGGRNGDEAVKKLILRLHEFQMSLPSPRAWQQEVLASFWPNDPEAFRISPLVGEAQRQVVLEARRIVGMLDEALRLCYLPSGPERYADRLLEEKAALMELWQMAESGVWDELCHLPDPFTSLPRITKAMQVDEELKAECQKLRNAAKDRFKKLGSSYLSRRESEIVREMKELYPKVQLIFQLVNQFTKEYQQAKWRQGILDFADLEQSALKLLTIPLDGGGLGPSNVALDMQDRFDEILIDEYQDTNGVQDCILAMVAGVKAQGPGITPRFMVGDIKQSIYGFRLTDPGLFLHKYHAFSPRREAPQRRIDLSTNFRCREEIIHGVNYIFRQLMSMDLVGICYDEEAELKYGATYPQIVPETIEVAAAKESLDAEGTSLRERRLEFYLLESGSVREADAAGLTDDGGDGVNDDDHGVEGDRLKGDFRGDIDHAELEQLEREAWLIARRIHRMVNGDGETWDGQMQDEGQNEPTLVWDKSLKGYRPIAYRDIVVLMRSVKGRANQVMEVFRQAGIPAYADLGSGYFAAIEVKLMVSLLQVLDNPQQDIPLAAVFRAPWVSLTEDELALVRLAQPLGSFYAAVMIASRQPDELGEKLRQTLECLDRWRTLARRLPLSELIWHLYRETGFYDYAGSMPKGEQRQANLRGLHDRAREFDEFSGRGLSRFVRFLERLQEEDDLGEVRPIGEGEDVVRVMSMHKSKGLEFPVVFLANLGKGFNQEDLKQDILLHKDLGLGLNVIDVDKRFQYSSLSHQVIKGRLLQDSLAEEMRILYVAMTRARERLILVGSGRDLAKNCAKWVSGVLAEDLHLSSDLLISAKHYLDWLCPAVCRHRDGETLRNAGGMKDPLSVDSIVADDPSSWYLWVEGYSKPLSWLYEPLDAKTDNMIPWQRIRELQPVHDWTWPEELDERFAQRLLWQYPAQSAANLPAKISVTELKRWVAAEADDGHMDGYIDQWSPAHGSSHLSAGNRRHVTRRPRFVLAEQDKVSAIERGIWTHTTLQHLDLTKDLAKMVVLKREATRLVQSGFITEAQLAAVDLESIRYFFQGALGQRLLEHPGAVWREVPFTLAIPTEKIYGHQGRNNDSVIIQGVIDCLVKEPRGFLLVDFKTDSVSSQEAPKAATAYQIQIDQYCQAVEMIFGQKVWQAYLYFLQGRVAVSMA